MVTKIILTLIFNVRVILYIDFFLMFGPPKLGLFIIYHVWYFSLSWFLLSNEVGLK